MSIRRNVFALILLLPLLGACAESDVTHEADAIPSDECFDAWSPGVLERMAAHLDETVCVRGWTSRHRRMRMQFTTMRLYDEVTASGDGFIHVDVDIRGATSMGYTPEDPLEAEIRLGQFVEVRGLFRELDDSIECDETYCGSALIVPSSIRRVEPEEPAPRLESLPDWAVRECYDADQRETWDRLIAASPESFCLYGHLNFRGSSGHFDLDGREPPFTPDGPPLRYINLRFDWSEAWDWGLIDRQRLLAEGDDFPLVLARFERWDLGCRVDYCSNMTLRPVEMWRIGEPAP